MDGIVFIATGRQPHHESGFTCLLQMKRGSNTSAMLYIRKLCRPTKELPIDIRQTYIVENC